MAGVPLHWINKSLHMPTFHSATLLGDLQQDVNNLLAAADRYLATQPHAILLQQPAPGSWSAIQCLEHLNGYGRYYLPAIDEAFRKFLAQNRTVPDHFKSGWLGNYFTQSMAPKPDGGLKMKMQSPGTTVPLPSSMPCRRSKSSRRSRSGCSPYCRPPSR